MNNTVPFHRGNLIQRGQGIGGIFSSLFRTLAPIGRKVIKEAPKLLKSASKSHLGKQLKRSAKRLAVNTAKDILQSGDINKSLKKSIKHSKNEIANILNQTNRQRQRKAKSVKICYPKKIKNIIL